MFVSWIVCWNHYSIADSASLQRNIYSLVLANYHLVNSLINKANDLTVIYCVHFHTHRGEDLKSFGPWYWCVFTTNRNLWMTELINSNADILLYKGKHFPLAILWMKSSLCFVENAEWKPRCNEQRVCFETRFEDPSNRLRLIAISLKFSKQTTNITLKQTYFLHIYFS